MLTLAIAHGACSVDAHTTRDDPRDGLTSEVAPAPDAGVPHDLVQGTDAPSDGDLAGVGDLPESPDAETDPDTDAEDALDSAPPDADPVFGPMQLVAATAGNSKTPVIASTGGALHVVWHDFTPRADGGAVPTLRHASRASPEAAWSEPALVLSEAGRNLFPTLAITTNHLDGHALHVAWQREVDGVTTLMHASMPDADHPGSAAFTAASPVVRGTSPRLVVVGSRLHVVGFDGAALAHASAPAGTADASGFVPSAPWPLSDAFVNTLDLAAVPEAPNTASFLVGFATSPGETSYDVRRVRWSPGSGWGTRETVFTSSGRSSDDLDAVAGPAGPAWVWTEQDADTPEDIPVVALDPSHPRAEPIRVTREAGFAMSPTAARLPDGRLVVAWVTPRDTIAVSFGPDFKADLDLGGKKATFPDVTVAPDGAVHVVFSARDEAGIQQIWHAEAR